MALSFIFYSPDRGDQIDRKLRGIPEALEALTATNGHHPISTDHLVLADALFSRAPDDFLHRCSLQTLARITCETEKCYRRFAENPDRPVLAWANHPADPDRSRFTSVVALISDRPFVVDSLMEFLRVKKLRHHVMLHPVLREGNQLISVTYLEIDRIDSEEQLAKLKAELEMVICDLALVTDQFSAMTAATKRAIQDVLELAERQKQSDAILSEVGELFQWLVEGNFVFLGGREWELGAGGRAKEIEGTDLGLYLSANVELRMELDETRQEVELLGGDDRRLLISKSTAESPIHRWTKMDVVTVKLAGDDRPVRFLTLVGLFTSHSTATPVTAVPILRRVLKSVLDAEGFPPNSYDYKEIISFVNGIPKSLLFQLDVTELRSHLHLMMGIQRRNEARIAFHPDPLKRFISVVVILPRDRFAAQITRSIQDYLQAQFGLTSRSSDYHLAIVEDLLATISFVLPHPESTEVEVSYGTLGKDIAMLTQTWSDKLSALLLQKCGRSVATRLMNFYEAGLPEAYMATTSPELALRDIEVMESLSARNPLDLRFRPAGDHYDLCIYRRGEGLTLSALSPFVENSGFELVAESLTLVTAYGLPWAAIHSLRLHPREGRTVRADPKQLATDLRAVFRREAENDRLNTLFLDPGLTVRQIAILRTIVHYLWQIRAFPVEGTIIAALTENPDAARELVDFFSARFDPELGTVSERQRTDTVADVQERFAQTLKQVTSLVHDRVLRAAWNVIESCVRTNAFRSESLRIALKVNCRNILSMPKPRPLFEIFVAAPSFEGVHLRGGKVARGGIRWSERPDDFRTEVLGLMKTQIVKNSIIVPTGAKGGFVLKGGEGVPRREVVVECYRNFIRSLLEVTDNRVESEVRQPDSVISYDEADPYLVVAADKGTADLSDVANEVATKEFRFWLGDAFASGGTNGYSHKRFGITARGAWETATRHFRELGKDVGREIFRVVGIGDMSGDVFGNGLLLSRRAMLIAAFDHREIFIDPHPDPESSFEERKRLFDLPHSRWSDYAAERISAGGGVFPRNSKEIILTAEAADALGITPGTYSGQEVVRAILRAPVDLIWNGGIGTYIRASFEDDITVADRGNDEVRITAPEVRARSIAEGGNLGLTQLARIEYAQRGGRVNTDAVDNSGGVNLSDFEVNIKVLLAQAVERQEMSLDERNALFFELAENVCERVLSRNRLQSLVITLDAMRSRSRLTDFQLFITFLERQIHLDRKGEFLPDDEAISRRALVHAGLTRPELAVLMAYAKIWLYQVVIDSPLPDDRFMTTYLFRYFPKQLGERFSRAVATHPLRREIIATQLVNIIVERMGATFVHRVMSEAEASPIEVISCFVVAASVVDSLHLGHELLALDRPNQQEAFHAAHLKLAGSIDRMVHWLLEHRDPRASVARLIDRYKDPVQTLLAQTELNLAAPDLDQFRSMVSHLTEHGFPIELARKIASTAYAATYLEAVEISETAGLPLADVARLYADLSAELKLSRLLQLANRLEARDRWEQAAVRSLVLELRSTLGSIVRAVVKQYGDASRSSYDQFLFDRAVPLESFHNNLRSLSDRPLSVAVLLVLSKQLQSLRKPVVRREETSP